MSVVSMIAAAIYLGVGAIAALASLSAERSGLPRSQGRAWTWVGYGFVALALVRVLDLEDNSRRALRSLLKNAGLYAGRWDWQAPLAALVLVAGCAAVYVAARRCLPRGGAPLFERLPRLAQLCLLAFLPLYGLRLVSLHVMDRILYSGPLRLNWVVDVALTLGAGLCACAYVYLAHRHRRFNRPPAPARRRRAAARPGRPS